MAALPVLVADVDRIVEWATVHPVFPCTRDKRPLTRNGFYDATSDEATIRRWWKDHPDALVGVPTGRTTGLVVIDFDPDKADSAAHEWISAHTATLTGTRTHTTARGGKHWVFQSVADEYSSGKDVFLDGRQRRGIDIRADGGYVIWWPLHGGTVVGEDAEPLPPNFLTDRRRQIPADRTLPKPARGLLAHARDWAHERACVVAALPFVDPNDRDVWVRIGLAIHLASGGHDDGFAVWHAWSAGGLTGDVPASYVSERDCRYHWQSFGKHANGKERMVTLGTLFAYAKAGGWERETTPEPPADDRAAPLETYTDDDIPPDLDGEEWSEPPRKEPAQARGLLRHISDILAEKREPEWLIHKVLEKRVLAVLCGPRGTFKSFIGLDWMARTALAGHGVVLFSGEGAGLDRRMDAWLRTNAPGVDPRTLPMVALERPLNLNLDETYAIIAAEIAALPWKPAAILVDTFSKFSAGLDENDNAEVAAFLSKLAEHLREQIGCTVLLVVHSGHADPKRPRGASALMANPDAEYIVERPDPKGMAVTVTRERFKDTAALEPLAYEATVVDLGRVDRYSEAVTSLALRPLSSEEAPQPAARRGKGRHQEAAINGVRVWADAHPDQTSITSDELRKVLGIDNRQRRHEATKYLVDVGILTPSVAGYRVNREVFL